jgi:hypothetical protein
MRVEEKGITLDEALRKLATIAANISMTVWQGPDVLSKDDLDSPAEYIDYCAHYAVNGLYDSSDVPVGDGRAVKPLWVSGQTTLEWDAVMYTIEEEIEEG